MNVCAFSGSHRSGLGYCTGARLERYGGELALRLGRQSNAKRVRLGDGQGGRMPTIEDGDLLTNAELEWVDDELRLVEQGNTQAHIVVVRAYELYLNVPLKLPRLWKGGEPGLGVIEVGFMREQPLQCEQIFRVGERQILFVIGQDGSAVQVRVLGGQRQVRPAEPRLLAELCCEKAEREKTVRACDWAIHTCHSLNLGNVAENVRRLRRRLT